MKNLWNTKIKRVESMEMICTWRMTLMTDTLGLDMVKDKLIDCIKNCNSSCWLRLILINNLMGKNN